MRRLSLAGVPAARLAEAAGAVAGQDDATDQPLRYLQDEVRENRRNVDRADRGHYAAKRTQHPLRGAGRPAQPSRRCETREPRPENANEQCEAQKSKRPPYHEREESRAAGIRREEHFAHEPANHVQHREQ